MVINFMQEAYILNTSFETIYVIDKYDSFIWTDRYSEYGDFELYTSPESDIATYAVRGNYIYSSSSEHLMIIEKIIIDTDTELGNHLTISGRSLESILERRVVWNQTILNGNFQNAVKKLITDAIISPSISARKISNFVFQDSTDSYITGLKIDTQFTGDNLYEVLVDLCTEKDIGFKVLLNESNQFVFSLYYGVNRSYDQTSNPFVTFSPSFENIVNSNYLEDETVYKNVALVAGEDEAENRKTVIVGSGSGLTRKELYVDARDIRMEDEGGNPISETDYNNMLRQRGNEKLKEDNNKLNIAFEGEVEAQRSFRYGEDFFLGDVVQIENEYGKEGVVRVTEFVMSVKSDGYAAYPTFKVVDEEDRS